MNKLLAAGKLFIQLNNRYPSRADLLSMGVSRDMIRHHFGNLVSFNEALYNHCKDLIFDLQKEPPDQKINVKKYKTFVITTALTGHKVHSKALNSVKTYCKKFNAKLIIQIAKGSSKLGETLDPELKGEYISLSDLALNNNIRLISVYQSGAKTDPTSGGITRTGKRDSTIILASPKQRLAYTATGIDKLAHATMGTGAITLPDYSTNKMSGYIADHDHEMGAIVVEIENDEIFHFRQIQFDSQGRLVDLGTLVDGNKITKLPPKAMVLGDWHSGHTDPTVAKASLDISKKLGINEWIMHDTFDANSCSHHDEGKLILLAKKANNKELSLENELIKYCEDIEMISKSIKNITIVKSNHDEHLERYLDEGRFIKDPQNTELGLELAGQLIKNTNIFQYSLKKYKPKVNIKNIKWLTRGESYSIGGIECGMHGDVGANGSRGSAQSMEKSYGKCVYGHSHTPSILRGAWCVGTSTKTSPDYGKGGASSWMNTHCIIYPNGMRQLINFINGKCSIRL